MNNYRYILERYKGMTTKHRCPNCEHDKKFTLYIDTETNEYIHKSVGRCDRSDNCGYHFKPKQYFESIGTFNSYYTGTRARAKTPQKTPPLIEPSFISFSIFEAGLGMDLNKNNFVIYLIGLLGIDSTKRLIERYYLTTSKLWNGATVFWQIDKYGKIRTGKIMLYNSATGKRDKTKNSWVHSALKLPDFNLKQCFFGEHLLKDKSKVVAIVESDKTAILMSYYLPQYIWLSSSGKEGLNAEKFSKLQGRTVILFPDLSKTDAKINCFELWSKKATEFKSIARITISDYLERIATEREKSEGLDIADYFTKYHSITNGDEVKIRTALLTKANIQSPLIPNESWSIEINELETYFNSATLPTKLIEINQCTTVTDAPNFVRSHLTTIKHNNGNLTFLPYLQRLKAFKQILTL